MKRFAVSVLCIFLLFTCLCTSALAAPEYYLEELGLTVSVPEDWITVTAEGEVPAEELAVLGYDGETVQASMKENHIYMDAFSIAPVSEMVLVSSVTDSSSTVFDFSRYTDEELMQVAAEIAGASQDAVYSDPTLFATEQLHFIVFHVQQTVGDKAVSGVQYYTVVNGRTLSLTLNTYGESVSDRQLQVLRDTAASMILDEIRPIPSGPTLWMILLGAVIILAATTAIFLFAGRRKKAAPRHAKP